MASESPLPDTERDRQFRHLDWRIQHVGWIIILLIILCAMIGAFGGGPLGNVTRGSAATFRVHYDRIARRSAPAALQVIIGASLLKDSIVSVSVSQPLVTTLSPQFFDPIPETMIVSSTAITYRFHVTPQTDSASVTFHCEPQALGVQRGTIRVANAPALPIRVFVLP
jgi:hypothetical protein